MSARNVYAAMDGEKYDVKLCFIDRTGRWWLLDAWQESLARHGGVQLLIAPGMKSFVTLPGNHTMHVDVLVPILHGENGHEDGMMQAIGAAMHVPVIGSGLGASAVCWDKLYTKQILAASGIAVVPYRVARAGQKQPRYNDVCGELGDVLFVKPTIAGSSIGVSKVHSEAEFEPALREAFKHSPNVLIEQAITGRELEIGVLGNPPHHRVSDVGEIIPGEEFYSYEDKYSSTSTAKVITHADIDETLRQQIRSIAHDSYETIGCKGLARIDFLVSESGEAYVNEFNTLPGFTNISQYPKLWHDQGIRYGELVDKLIKLAIER